MKVNIFSLTVQYLDKHCKTWKGQYKAGIREAGVDWTVKCRLHLCCLYAASGRPGLEIKVMHCRTLGFPGASATENPPAVLETRSIPGSGKSLEEEMAAHFRILAWEIPWTEESGRLRSLGPQESGTTQRLNHHRHHDCTLCSTIR